MRRETVLMAMATVAFAGAGSAAAKNNSAPVVTAPDVSRLSTLRGSGAPSGPAGTPAARQRETLDHLSAQGRAVHTVLSKGGQLSLASGPVAVEVERDGHLKLVGPVCSQWVDADRVLLYGGELTVDENIALVVRNEHLEEARIRDGRSIEVLIPPSGQTVRSVGIFRESTTPTGASAPLASAPALSTPLAASDDNPYAVGAPLPFAALNPSSASRHGRVQSPAQPSLPATSGAPVARAALSVAQVPTLPRATLPAAPTAGEVALANSRPPPAEDSLATTTLPARREPPPDTAQPGARTPARASASSGVTNRRFATVPGPVDDELRTIADIDARLRETRALYAGLLQEAPHNLELSDLNTDLDRLEQRVVDLWREADAVLHVSHRVLADEEAAALQSHGPAAAPQLVGEPPVAGTPSFTPHEPPDVARVLSTSSR